MHTEGIGRNGVARGGDCGRPLHDPESISHGIGPICACKTPAASVPSAGLLCTDRSAPPLLDAGTLAEISPSEEQVPMPPVPGTPAWFIMKQRLLASLRSCQAGGSMGANRLSGR